MTNFEIWESWKQVEGTFIEGSYAIGPLPHFRYGSRAYYLYHYCKHRIFHSDFPIDLHGDVINMLAWVTKEKEDFDLLRDIPVSTYRCDLCKEEVGSRLQAFIFAWNL